MAEKNKVKKGAYSDTSSALGVGEFENRTIEKFEPEDLKNKKKKK